MHHPTPRLATALAVLLSLAARTTSHAQTMHLVEDRNTDTSSVLSSAHPYADRAILSVQLGQRPHRTTWITDGTVVGTTPLTPPFDEQSWYGRRIASVGDWLLYASGGLWLTNPRTGETHHLSPLSFDVFLYGDTVLLDEVNGPSRYRLDPLTSTTLVPFTGPVPTTPTATGTTDAVRVGDEIFFTRSAGQPNRALWSFSLSTNTATQRTLAVVIETAAQQVQGFIVGRETLGTGEYSIYRFDPRTNSLTHRILTGLDQRYTWSSLFTTSHHAWIEACAVNSSGGTDRVVYRFNPATDALDVITVRPNHTSAIIVDPIVTADALYYKVSSTEPGAAIFRLSDDSLEPQLVTDPWPGPPLSSGTIGGLFLRDNRLWFIGRDNAHGSELWVHDLNTGNTRLVRDINPGPASSAIQFLGTANANGPLLVAADDGVHGIELWRSDGTEAGTFLLRDFQTGTNGTQPWDLREVNGRLAFSGRSIGFGEPSVPLTAPSTPYLGRAFDRAVRTPAGRELLYYSTWTSTPSNLGIAVTDGTPEGTRLLTPPAGFSSGPCNSAATNGDGQSRFGLLDNGGVVTAQFATINCALWLADAAQSVPVNMTRLPISIEPRISLSSSTWLSSGEFVYIAAFTHDFGRELVRTDGTPEGTIFLDLAPGAPGSNPKLHLAIGDTLFFSASPTSTTEGFYKAVWPRGAPSPSLTRLFPLFSSEPPMNVGLTGSMLLYSPTTNYRATSLWSVDTHTLARRQVSTFFPWAGMTPASYEPAYMPVGGRLCFFAAEGPQTPGGTSPKIFAYDPNTDTVARLADSTAPNTSQFAPIFLTPLHNHLLFAMNDGVHGQELWITDGTPGGTRLFLDAVPGPASSSPTEAAVVEGVLYLAASTPEYGGELYSIQLCRGDVNLDFTITIEDLLLFLTAFEQGDLLADLDDDDEGHPHPDGAVTIDDLLYMLRAFEGSCA